MNLIEEIQSENPEYIADVLIKNFGGILAYDCAIVVQSQLSMYEGDINPKWKFWNEIARIVYEKVSTEQQSVINHFKTQKNA